MMMESRSALIERRQGWPTPASRCLKIQHQSFKCLKERVVQKGPEGRRLPPLASGSRTRSMSHPPYFEPTRRLRERAEKTGGVPRAWLPRHHHLFAKVSAETFVAGIFSA